MPGHDPVRPHKERAIRALIAQLRFAAEKSPDMPGLPLNDREDDFNKWQSGLHYLIAAYTCFLRSRADAPVHPLDLLYERSCTMAGRVLAGQVDFIDGVDSCYNAADWAGLVDHYGDDLIQSILAEAFMCDARKDAA